MCASVHYNGDLIHYIGNNANISVILAQTHMNCFQDQSLLLIWNLQDSVFFSSLHSWLLFFQFSYIKLWQVKGGKGKAYSLSNYCISFCRRYITSLGSQGSSSTQNSDPIDTYPIDSAFQNIDRGSDSDNERSRLRELAFLAAQRRIGHPENPN